MRQRDVFILVPLLVFCLSNVAHCAPVDHREGKGPLIYDPPDWGTSYSNSPFSSLNEVDHHDVDTSDPELQQFWANQLQTQLSPGPSSHHSQANRAKQPVQPKPPRQGGQIDPPAQPEPTLPRLSKAAHGGTDRPVKSFYDSQYDRMRRLLPKTLEQGLKTLHFQASSSEDLELPSQEEIANRPVKINNFAWQLKLKEEDILKIYHAISAEWGERPRTTHLLSLERLNKLLEEQPSLPKRILNNDELVIEYVVSQTQPCRRYQGRSLDAKVDTIQSVDSFLKSVVRVRKSHIGRPLDKKRPKWAPFDLSREDLDRLPHILSKAWNLQTATVRTRLRRIGQPAMFVFASGVLSKHPKIAHSASEELRKLTELRGVYRERALAEPRFEQARLYLQYQSGQLENLGLTQPQVEQQEHQSGARGVQSSQLQHVGNAHPQLCEKQQAQMERQAELREQERFLMEYERRREQIRRQYQGALRHQTQASTYPSWPEHYGQY